MLSRYWVFCFVRIHSEPDINLATQLIKMSVSVKVKYLLSAVIVPSCQRSVHSSISIYFGICHSIVKLQSHLVTLFAIFASLKSLFLASCWYFI